MTTVRMSRNALARHGQRAGYPTLAARAAILGISISHLNKVERGELRASARVLDAMADAYHVHADKLERDSRNSVRALRTLQLDDMDDTPIADKTRSANR
jgi:transcriptional regulator with XRE-family HTH domain